MRLAHRLAVILELGLRELRLRFHEPGVALQHELGRALVGLGHFLRDFTDAPAGGHGDVAGVALQPVRQQREERRLASAVAADEADLLAGLERHARLVEHELDAAAQRDLLNGEHERGS